MSQSPTKTRFGTDGIRGPANEGPLNIEEVLRLGEATANLLQKRLKRRGAVGLGWDTRISSPALAHALSAGLSAGGAKTIKFGVIPTPAVARLTVAKQLDAGIVISASHNPVEDNGIKYFDHQGGKFPDAYEQALERQLIREAAIPRKTGRAMGMIEEWYGDAAMVYRRQVVRQFAQAGLKGLRLVVDMAHGATCRTAPAVLQDLGIEVYFLGDKPNGLNINDHAGSLYPGKTAAAVKRLQAHAGLAFDGDGDRVIMIDEQGGILNGDRMMGLLALFYKKKRKLPGNTVVSTVMSNLGLEHYFQRQGITLLRAPVGDRYVWALMQQKRAILGGEQSGHMLLPRLTPAGDGLVTALEVLAVMRAQNRPLSELCAGWSNFPQLLVNVPVAHRPELQSLPAVKAALQAGHRALGSSGRFNLRYSGTESLARVMVEAPSRQEAVLWADRLASAIEKEIGISQQRRETWLTYA